MVEPRRGVPKGKQRRKLKDEGFEEILEIKCNMSPINVQSAIAEAFGTIDYKLLSVQDGRLDLSSSQRPSGDEVVEIITKRKSPMYICCNVDSDDELITSSNNAKEGELIYIYKRINIQNKFYK